MSFVPQYKMSTEERIEQVFEEVLRIRTPGDCSVDSVSPSYRGIVFEQSAYQCPVITDKALLPYKALLSLQSLSKSSLFFDVSLARLQKTGFERHPRPQETFGLMIDDLEGKLTGRLKDVSDNMFKSYGEWLSLAFERKGDVLVAYVDPKNLFWDKNVSKYVVQGRQVDCAGKETFDIRGKQSKKIIELEAFEDKFITFLYNRSFNQLPKEAREGVSRAQVYLPSEGVVCPVGRGFIVGTFGVYGHFNDGRSRGVRNTKTSAGVA